MHLKVSHISKSFRAPRGVHHVLRDFSFDVKSGECVGLVGPNGCGKTTFFHILTGLACPDSGEIEVDDKKIPSQPQEIFSLLPEQPRLPKYTSGRDILKEYAIFSGLSPDEINERMNSLDSLFQLSMFWDKPSLHYSRGQACLLSLARLALDPKDFLLLDEPTNGLDFETSKKVYSWIDGQLNDGKGVVVATHLIGDLMSITSRQFGVREGMNVSQSEVASWMKKFQSPHNSGGGDA